MRREQRAIVKQAQKDLDALGCGVWCPVESGPEGQHADYPDAIGLYHFQSDKIWVRDDQEGAALYRVVLHELGHALGLEHHKGRGIMAPKRHSRSPDFQRTAPTLRQRRRWAAEIARAVLELRQRRIK